MRRGLPLQPFFGIFASAPQRFENATGGLYTPGAFRTRAFEGSALSEELGAAPGNDGAGVRAVRSNAFSLGER